MDSSPPGGGVPLIRASQVDYDTSDCTVDTLSDDEGVFLGPRQPRELDIIAKLSIAPTPSPQIFRARKRDSREYLRRRSLMIAVERRDELSPRRLRVNEESSDSEEGESQSHILSSTPLKGHLHSDISLQLAAFHLSSPAPVSSTELEEDEDSDKENVPVPPPVHIPDDGTELVETVVSIGQDFQSADESEDEVTQLDMGGLKLSDFDDPDLGLSGSTTASPIHNDSASESFGDSPLPVARAGPVVIPVLSHHFTNIRAETSSPCRTMPVSPMPLIPVPEADEAIQLTSLQESPRAAESTVATTPSRLAALPPLDLVERGKKLLKASTLQKPLARPDKSGQRALTIRGQLDSVLTSRISALGPPQRSVSSSSTASTASSSAKTTTKHTIIATSRPPPIAGSRPITLASSVRSSSAVSKPVYKAGFGAKVASSKTHFEVEKPEIRVLASARPPLRPALSTQPTASRNKIVPPSSIPLKRPLPQSAPPSRLPLVAAVSRPTLGMPSRFARDAVLAPLPVVPVFSAGMGDGVAMSRIAFRSPAKNGLVKRSVAAGTPRKQLGTPSRFGTPRHTTLPVPISFANDVVSSSATPLPAQDVSIVRESASSGPPASATRQAQATEDRSSSPPARGSSEDQEEVSVQLVKAPSSSPTNSPERSSSSKTKATRSRRSKSTPVEPKARKVSADVSEKEIKTATQRNTMRNQVYHCAIDRQIIRKDEPRPPSPTSKIRTTADREEEEKKSSRGARAKRRTGEESPEKPVVETLTRTRAPGDDEDFVTPTRPAKKSKTDEKFVKWGKDLTVIRDDGSTRPPSRSGSDSGLKSCLKGVKTPLDHLGNLEDAAPVENLKRMRIVVTAVFYQGEEPVAPAPAPSSATRSKKK